MLPYWFSRASWGVSADARAQGDTNPGGQGLPPRREDIRLQADEGVDVRGREASGHPQRGGAREGRPEHGRVGREKRRPSASPRALRCGQGTALGAPRDGAHGLLEK